MVAPLTKRTPIQSVVKGQLPEHIREDYPTFVAFVEAYYEYMQRNGVNLKQIRDIDETLEDFIVQFKKELAYNLPIVVEDERFLLSRIKDQYLSKGSEASYKLLFKLLFGKNVELNYPGRSMLVASDGRWNQEISVFAQVDYGNPDDIVGKLVDIQTAGRILRVLVDKKEELIGEVDRIVKIGKSYEIQTTASSGSTILTVTSPVGIEVNQLVTGAGIVLGSRVTKIEGSLITISKATTAAVNNLVIYSNELYEFFLDKRFFGVVNPGDLIKFRDEFQARIVPATQTLQITQPGKNFRVGQVFELRSGAGTGALMKVTAVTPTGGIKYAEFIKFGLGYTANFALSILATNDVISSSSVNIIGTSTLTELNTYESAGAGTISATTSSTTVTGTGTNFGQVGGAQIGDEIWTTDATPLIVGVVKSIASTTSLTLVGLPAEHDLGITSSYSGSYVFRNKRNVGSLYAPGGIQAITHSPTLSDRSEGFNEQGYVNLADYVTYEYVDGAYAGSIIREFSLNYRNAQINADEPAVIFINLGAIVRYPGFFEANNGFVSDSIYIQDSRYYQAFSYVIRIDEKLSTYKSAVKTMLHPAGMALFGEFQITNEFDLSVELESLVKSLGIGLEDNFSVLDSISDISIYAGKVIFDTLDTPDDSLVLKVSFKTFEETLTQTDELTQLIGKVFNETSLNYDGVAEGQSVVMQSTSTTKDIDKSLSTIYTGIADDYSAVLDKPLADSFALADVTSIGATKYLETQYSGLSFTESGQVWLNPYALEDYFLTPTDYNEFNGETF